MSIEATGRVINPIQEQKKLQSLYEFERNRIKKSGAKRNFVNRVKPTVLCTQCTHKMAKDMADKQLFYGRENAPICMACIMGVKRVPVKEKIKILKQRESPKAKKAFKKFIKNMKEIHNA